MAFGLLKSFTQFKLECLGLVTLLVIDRKCQRKADGCKARDPRDSDACAVPKFAIIQALDSRR